MIAALIATLCLVAVNWFALIAEGEVAYATPTRMP
jgi:hypothetical protein